MGKEEEIIAICSLLNTVLLFCCWEEKGFIHMVVRLRPCSLVLSLVTVVQDNSNVC